MQAEELTSQDRRSAAELWDAVGLTRPWNDPLDDFDRALRGPTSTVLGLREAGRLTATVMVGNDGHRGWMYYLAVDPARRSQGLGQRMLAAAESWLRAAGAVKVQLMVRRSNREAVSFYEDQGYADAEVLVLARWLEPGAGP
jgi:hypothetical protein